MILGLPGRDVNFSLKTYILPIYADKNRRFCHPFNVMISATDVSLPYLSSSTALTSFFSKLSTIACCLLRVSSTCDFSLKNAATCLLVLLRLSLLPALCQPSSHLSSPCICRPHCFFMYLFPAGRPWGIPQQPLIHLS